MHFKGVLAQQGRMDRLTAVSYTHLDVYKRQDEGRGGGHDDGGGDVGVLGGVGHALGVVAGGGGNETGGFLLLGQGADGVIRAANLVAVSYTHLVSYLPVYSFGILRAS